MCERKAFTLIELLVVIAIIALLLAVIMPALKRAKYLAMRMQCISNVRQQCLSFINYATDNEGRYPEHMGALPYYYRGREDYKTPFDRLNDTYIEDSKIMFCPVTRKIGRFMSSLEWDEGNGWGAWEAVDETTGEPLLHIVGNYAWFAGFTPGTTLEQWDNKITFYNPEPAWPLTMEEASSLNATIAHTLFENDWWGFYDYSHGGNDRPWGEGKTFEDMETLDNPLCQGDGSVTIRKKSEVEIKAVWDYGGYNQFYY
jgi:prepilin-type N-terminal cleavage/methylation domain-containing protein